MDTGYGIACKEVYYLNKNELCVVNENCDELNEENSRNVIIILV